MSEQEFRLELGPKLEKAQSGLSCPARSSVNCGFRRPGQSNFNLLFSRKSRWIYMRNFPPSQAVGVSLGAWRISHQSNFNLLFSRKSRWIYMRNLIFPTSKNWLFSWVNKICNKNSFCAAVFSSFQCNTRAFVLVQSNINKQSNYFLHHISCDSFNMILFSTPSRSNIAEKVVMVVWWLWNTSRQ
jgi:hypothetical protein